MQFTQKAYARLARREDFLFAAFLFGAARFTVRLLAEALLAVLLTALFAFFLATMGPLLFRFVLK
jgi:hypothetical protein